MNFIKNFLENRKEKRFVDTSTQDFSVTLPPIFGIEAKVYLRILIVLLAILLFFLLLILPGIKKNGSIVSFTSTPSNAAVYVNEQYIGSTPLKRFIPKGEHQFSLKYTGAKDNILTKKIKGRILFSSIFPKKDQIEFNVLNVNPSLTVTNTIKQFNTISFYHSFENETIPPPIISYATQYILASEDKKSISEQLNRLFIHVTPLANTPELKRDCFYAFFIASGISSNELAKQNRDIPDEILFSISERIIDLSHDYPQVFYDYIKYFTLKEQRTIKKTLKYINFRDSLVNYCNLPISTQFGKPTGKTMVRDGIKFLEFYGGYYRFNDEYTLATIAQLTENDFPPLIPQLYYFSNFYISERTVTSNEFNMFLSASPEMIEKWASSNQINRYFNPSSNRNEITGISWHAAKSFAIEKKMRLPHYIELEATKDIIKGSTLQEWCEDSYLPSSFTISQNYPERILRLPSEFSSLPAEFCSEFATFRLAFSNSPMIPVSLARLE